LYIYGTTGDTAIINTDTSYLFDGSSFFQNNTVYSWHVSADDGLGTTQSDTFHLNVSIPVAVEDYDYDVITIYPNPVHQILTVSLNKATVEQASEIRITGLSGIIEKVFPFNNSVDVSSLKDGMYILTVINNKGEEMATKKIFKH